MSLDTIWNSENLTLENKKDLSSIDVSWIEENYVRIQEIRNMELVDSEDNTVTIPSDLQDFFWDKIDEDSELLSKVDILKNKLYESLNLNSNLEENSDIWKFKKWFIDWLVIDNIELVNDLLDKWFDELVNMIISLTDWDIIKEIVKDAIDSFWDILNTFTNPYEWWKALWWLWLWVVWKWMMSIKTTEKLLNSESLYNKDEYKFLEDYRDILWDNLTEKDIVWKWNNAITLKSPWFDNKLIKISRWWEADKLDLEFEKHKEFRQKLREFKKIYKWKPEWDILDKFEIPIVSNYDWKTGIFEMEKIDWLSFKSIIHLDYYKKELSDVPNDFYKWKTDNEISLFLEKKWLQEHPWTRSKEDIIMDKMNNDEARDFFDLLNNLEWKRFNIERTEINPFLDIFKKEWYYHKDEHWWNFMKTKDEKIYMIDFWRSEVPK